MRRRVRLRSASVARSGAAWPFGDRRAGCRCECVLMTATGRLGAGGVRARCRRVWLSDAVRGVNTVPCAWLRRGSGWGVAVRVGGGSVSYGVPYGAGPPCRVGCGSGAGRGRCGRRARSAWVCGVGGDEGVVAAWSPGSGAQRRGRASCWSTEHGARSTEHGARSTEHGARSTGAVILPGGTGHGARGTGHGARGTGHGARGTGHGAAVPATVHGGRSSVRRGCCTEPQGSRGDGGGLRRRRQGWGCA